MKLKSMKKCLPDRRLQRFRHLERMEESAWSSKYGTFKGIGNSLCRLNRKTGESIIMFLVRFCITSKNRRLEASQELQF